MKVFSAEIVSASEARESGRVTKDIQFKFEPGDRLRVVKEGRGTSEIPEDECVIVKMRGIYTAKSPYTPGYVINNDHSGDSNSKDGQFLGVCGEESFEYFDASDLVDEQEGKATPNIPNTPKLRIENFEEGDTVKVLYKHDTDYLYWNTEMDRYIGKTGKVTDIFMNPSRAYPNVRVKFDDGNSWQFLPNVLDKISEEPTEFSVGKWYKVVKSGGELWCEGMNEMIGKIYQCEEISERGSVRLNRWWFNPGCLQETSEPPKPNPEEELKKGDWVELTGRFDDIESVSWIGKMDKFLEGKHQVLELDEEDGTVEVQYEGHGEIFWFLSEVLRKCDPPNTEEISIKEGDWVEVTGKHSEEVLSWQPQMDKFLKGRHLVKYVSISTDEIQLKYEGTGDEWWFKKEVLRKCEPPIKEDESPHSEFPPEKEEAKEQVPTIGDLHPDLYPAGDGSYPDLYPAGDGSYIAHKPSKALLKKPKKLSIFNK